MIKELTVIIYSNTMFVFPISITNNIAGILVNSYIVYRMLYIVASRGAYHQKLTSPAMIFLFYHR